MATKKLQQTAANRRYRNATPIGAALLIFAVIGVIAVLTVSYDFTVKLLDNSKEKSRFEQMLLPVLMFDPIPFDDVSTVDPLSILQSSLWATLLGEKRDTYAYDENGRLVVPQSDVDVTAANLFGPSIKLEHQSFGDYEISYYYEPAIKAYHVPVTAQTGFYVPKVMTINREKDVYTLLVGYVPPSTVWNTDFNGNSYDPPPDKYMVYVFQKVDRHYQLISIKYPTDEQIAKVDPDSPYISNAS